MTDIQAIRELMTRFDDIVAQIKEALPNATEQEVMDLAGAAMNTALNL